MEVVLPTAPLKGRISSLQEMAVSLQPLGQLRRAPDSSPQTEMISVPRVGSGDLFSRYLMLLCSSQTTVALGHLGALREEGQYLAGDRISAVVSGAGIWSIKLPPTPRTQGSKSPFLPQTRSPLFSVVQNLPPLAQSTSLVFYMNWISSSIALKEKVSSCQATTPPKKIPN